MAEIVTATVPPEMRAVCRIPSARFLQDRHDVAPEDFKG